MAGATVGAAASGRRSPCIKNFHFLSIFACVPAPLSLEKRSQAKWPVRLSVRTSGFQPEKRGSTPLRAATSLLKAFIHWHLILQVSHGFRGVGHFALGELSQPCRSQTPPIGRGQLPGHRVPTI